MDLIPREIMREIFILIPDDINGISRVNKHWNEIARSIQMRLMIQRARKLLPVMRQFTDTSMIYVDTVRILISPGKQVLIHHLSGALIDDGLYDHDCADIWVFRKELTGSTTEDGSSKRMSIGYDGSFMYESIHTNMRDLLSTDYELPVEMIDRLLVGKEY